MASTPDSATQASDLNEAINLVYERTGLVPEVGTATELANALLEWGEALAAGNATQGRLVACVRDLVAVADGKRVAVDLFRVDVCGRVTPCAIDIDRGQLVPIENCEKIEDVATERVRLMTETWGPSRKPK